LLTGKRLQNQFSHAFGGTHDIGWPYGLPPVEIRTKLLTLVAIAA
jgi:hypothetical protein